MAALRVAISCLFLALVPAVSVTPIEKVITLMEDLVSQVESEGKAEAATYDEFACFCKDTTMSKSEAITNGRDDIDSDSALIAEKTAEKEEKTTELQERKVKQEKLAAELEETTVRCAKAQAEYEATNADLEKAIKSLEGAIGAMEQSMSASFLQSVRNDVERSLIIAEALDLVDEKKHKAVSSLIQGKVDPEDPAYKYHSDGIIDTLKKLLTEFRAEKETTDAEWAKTDQNCKDTTADLTGSMTTNEQSMTQLETDIEDLKGVIATAREELVDAEATLKDDQEYVKDLTKRCESRAKDWDQRSQMRADELEALTKALEIIKDTKDTSDEVNKRALLQRGVNASKANATKAAVNTSAAKNVSIAPHKQAVSLLQDAATIQKAKRALRGGAGLSAQARQERVISLLQNEGIRLKSPLLSQLAAKASADPFAKIKTLIQGLIERLLREAEAEATKKGFCDTELGKANKDRDYRWTESQELNVELKGLEIKKAELEQEIELLKEQVKDLKQTLNETTEIRKTEHDENIETIEKAKEGLEAVTEALTILKVFYKKAAKASLLSAKVTRESPVDADTEGAGFKGSYKGNQAASNGIIGMIEVIKTDFERTIKMTTSSEKKAQAEFIEFDRVSKSDIAGKETKTELDEEDLKKTDHTIETKMDDLKRAVELLDSALKTLEDLKPTCIDTGMSFEERKEKREEEIAALKDALCILDAEGVESECGGQK